MKQRSIGTGAIYEQRRTTSSFDCCHACSVVDAK